jgi:hypothetical protein
VHLSKYFTLEELIFSQTATRLNIDNKPSKSIILQLTKTATKLDNIRNLLNKPIFISSGYRGPILNARIGSSITSQHLKGEAVDFTCKEFGSPRKVVLAILASGIEFDQLILEYDAWVHISFVDSGNRKQALIINKKGTRVFS